MSSASPGQAFSSYHITHTFFFQHYAAGLVLSSEHKCILSQSLSIMTKLMWARGKGIHTVMKKGGEGT